MVSARLPLVSFAILSMAAISCFGNRIEKLGSWPVGGRPIRFLVLDLGMWFV
jgi:hypothetical protein